MVVCLAVFFNPLCRNFYPNRLQSREGERSPGELILGINNSTLITLLIDPYESINSSYRLFANLYMRLVISTSR